MELKVISQYDDSIAVVANGNFENLGFNLRSVTAGTLTYCQSHDFLPICFESDVVSAIITSRDLYESWVATHGPVTKGVAISCRPVEDFFGFHNFLATNTKLYERTIENSVGQKCRISQLANVSKKNVQIGENVFIDDFVKICDNVTIGDNTVIRAGTVIGDHGFQAMSTDRGILKVIHVGGVHIGENVEIMPNCTVGKHIFNDDTTIGNNSVLDYFVHIAHGSKIGSRCRLAANVVIAGSTTIEDDVFVGPSATISTGLNVGSGAFITLGSVVTKDVGPGQRVTGNFAIAHDRFIDFMKSIR